MLKKIRYIEFDTEDRAIEFVKKNPSGIELIKDPSIYFNCC